MTWAPVQESWVKPDGVDWPAISGLVLEKLNAGQTVSKLDAEIYTTMFYMDPHWQWELASLPQAWQDRFAGLPGVTSNTVHTAFHLYMYEREMGESLLDSDSLVEIGGGFGEMCRLIRALGFTGRTTLVDLPGMLRLQEDWLTKAGVTDVEFSEELVPADTLLATWSLSEASPEMRESALRAMPGFSRALFAYQPTFNGRPNHSYFTEIMKAAPRMRWSGHPAVAPSTYLFGAKA